MRFLCQTNTPYPRVYAKRLMAMNVLIPGHKIFLKDHGGWSCKCLSVGLIVNIQGKFLPVEDRRASKHIFQYLHFTGSLLKSSRAMHAEEASPDQVQYRWSSNWWKPLLWAHDSPLLLLCWVSNLGASGKEALPMTRAWRWFGHQGRCATPCKLVPATGGAQ